METAIHRITGENEALLAAIAEDVFDDPIDPGRLRRFLADPGHALFIAHDGSEVIGQIRGIVHLQPDRATDLYIDNLGVTPTAQRRGVASRLINALIEWGAAQGCTYVWVATEPDNHEGIGFYNARGFERRTLEWFASDMSGDDV